MIDVAVDVVALVVGVLLDRPLASVAGLVFVLLATDFLDDMPDSVSGRVRGLAWPLGKYVAISAAGFVAGRTVLAPVLGVIV